MVMMAPAGALVDATTRKRLFVIVPGCCTVLASGIVLLSQQFWLVTLSQIATAIAGAAIVPATALTMGQGPWRSAVRATTDRGGGTREAGRQT